MHFSKTGSFYFAKTGSYHVAVTIKRHTLSLRPLLINEGYANIN